MAFELGFLRWFVCLFKLGELVRGFLVGAGWGCAWFFTYIQVMDPTNRLKEVIIREICTHDFLDIMMRFLGPDTGMA